MTKTEAMLQATGLTTRQLTHWTARGYLHPEGCGGSGNRFHWPAEEIRAAKLMKTLVDADITPAGAARAARNGLILIPGIRIVLDNPLEEPQ